MAIGALIRIGWDAVAVRTGLASLPGLFSRAMRQVGVGAARQVGTQVSDLLGKALLAIPSGIREMIDYSGAMDDLSRQTGVAIKDLILLEEAMRLSGVEGDNGRLISGFAKNLKEATKEITANQQALNKYGARGALDAMEQFSGGGGSNPGADALRKLGFDPQEIKGLKVDEAFEKIGMRAKDFTGDVGELEEAMSDLFGARMGYRLIRFFKEYDSSMAKTKNNVGDFANVMEQKAATYADIGDALDRYKVRWRALMEVIASAVGIGTSADPINKAFDWLNPERIRRGAEMLKNTIAYLREQTFGFFKGGGFSELFKNLGRSLGEGIRESLGDLNPFKGFFGKDKPAQQDRTSAMLLEQSRMQTRSLSTIERSGFPAYLT